MDKELTTLIGRLQDNSKGCEEKCLDFQALKFEAKESEMRLFTPSRSYFFKSDPKNPKDPKIVHAAKQFCKIQKIPYSFFAKSPEYMKKSLVDCWLPTIKPDQSAVLAKLRETKTDGVQIIRALLPVEFTNIPNAEVVQMVGDAVKDAFRIEFVIGDDRDDIILHVRLISNETFSVGEDECSTGFSVIASELGATPISIETMLFRNNSKGAFIASYSGESYFETNYEGIQPAALRELFPRLISQLQEQLSDLEDKVKSAKDSIEKKEDVGELLRNIRLRKGLNEKFHTLLLQEIESNPVENRWDFVNRMAILAKDFDVVSRVKIEKLAGELIGLIFEKA
jgi:hypothetical protein